MIEPDATTLHPTALIALRAVQLLPTIGRDAAWRYARRHGAAELFTLARVLAAAQADMS